MEAKIVERKRCKLLGIGARINPMQADYGALWAAFSQHADAMGAMAIEEGAYSAYYACDVPDMADFVGGMVVADDAVAPEGLVLREVPGGTYAAFEGRMDTIGQTWGGIYESWLPQSDWVADESRPGLEYYAPDQMGPTGVVRVLVPVNKS